MTPKPIAFAAIAADASESIYVSALREQAEAACHDYGWQLVPLYARPSLTDAEREAVEWAANGADPYYTGHTATLRGLLERLA